MRAFKPFKPLEKDDILPIMIQKGIEQLTPYLVISYRVYRGGGDYRVTCTSARGKLGKLSFQRQVIDLTTLNHIGQLAAYLLSF